MVRSWYMSASLTDQQDENHKSPPQYVSLPELYFKTGVEYFPINMATYKTDGVLEALKKKRGYTYEDEITCSTECLTDYAVKLKHFFTEHLHTDEEIRLIVDGSGYFDVRDGTTDEWIRIAVTAGDLIVIPSGIYHRFTMDAENFIKAKRFFVGEPVWLPYNRPAGEMKARHDYLDKLIGGFVKGP